MAQHVIIWREKDRLLWPLAGESSCTAEGSYWCGHEFPAHGEALAAPIHFDVHSHYPHHLIGPDVSALASYSRGPINTSLLSIYAHHVAIHVWEAEVG